MFDLVQLLENYASETGGQFNSFSSHEMAIIVPAGPERFQTVHAEIRQINNRPLLSFASKICPVTPDLSYETLLELVQRFSYSRLYIYEGYLQVEALVPAPHSVPLEVLKFMIQEVANIADQYEKKLTGRDVE